MRIATQARTSFEMACASGVAHLVSAAPGSLLSWPRIVAKELIESELPASGARRRFLLLSIVAKRSGSKFKHALLRWRATTLSTQQGKSERVYVSIYVSLFLSLALCIFLGACYVCLASSNTFQHGSISPWQLAQHTMNLTLRLS